MLRHARARGLALDWTFYCALGRAGRLDHDARSLGARVVHSPVEIGDTAAFIRALRAELRRGSYDILHCHHDLVSSVYLVAAAGLRIRRRLVHAHNPDECVPTPSRVKQSLLRPVMRQTCLTMADRIVGNSNHTLDTFLAGRPRRPGRDVVHYYGVDHIPFARDVRSREQIRRDLDVPVNARLLLFAGRVVPEKNPVFAVDVLAEIRRRDAAAVGIFVGSGSLDHAIQRRARELGLDAAFRHLGWRRDVPELMAASDWFILPHPEVPMEGFGLAVVEAQLAGLRLLLSNGITDDPLLPTARSVRLSLAAGPAAWADAAMALLDGPVPSADAAIRSLQASPMDMDRALDYLVALHTSTGHE
jgi:glycosyltransferase involved in cell wall biosynthesis